MVALVLIALQLAAPYEDIHERFKVDLPNEWQLAPMPGDTGGVTFRRVRDKTLALCSIRVTPLKGVDLDGYVKRLTSGSANEQGYKPISGDSDTLAGHPAYKRKFGLDVDKEGKIKKIVEERITIINGFGYIVHAESLESTFDGFADDFKHFADTFQPKGGGEVAGTTVISAQRMALVGTWRLVSDPTTALVLNPNGTLTMGNLQGQYRIDANKLIMQLNGSVQETFNWSKLGDTLSLTSPSLGADVIKYKKQQ